MISSEFSLKKSGNCFRILPKDPLGKLSMNCFRNSSPMTSYRKSSRVFFGNSSWDNSKTLQGFFKKIFHGFLSAPIPKKTFLGTFLNSSRHFFRNPSDNFVRKFFNGPLQNLSQTLLEFSSKFFEIKNLLGIHYLKKTPRYSLRNFFKDSCTKYPQGIQILSEIPEVIPRELSSRTFFY